MDVRRMHLHHHLLAAGKAGHVHLPHRGAADRHRVERLERLLECEAEFLLHHLADGIERLGSGLVLQLAQLGDDVVGNHVGARGQQLPAGVSGWSTYLGALVVPGGHWSL